MTILPSLPQHDPLSRLRAEQRSRAQDEYRFHYEWPPGVATVETLSKRDDYSVEYVARLLPVAWQLFTNTLAMAEHLVDADALRRFFESERERLKTLEPRAIGAWFLSLSTKISRHVTATNVRSLSVFDEMHRTIPAIDAQKLWRSDELFAWQRVAGVNPMAIRRVRSLPEWCSIDEPALTRAGSVRGSLASALAEGRAFACDYSVLHNARTGVTFDRAKSLPAPYALFVAQDGALVPVAIQLAPTRDAKVLTAADGAAWNLAKVSVNIADANVHETIEHLGRTHMVMEAVTIALKRQLADAHPLRKLIEPHTEFTLAINHSAATNLIAPGGTVDEAFGGHIETSASVVRLGLDSFDLRKSAPPVALAERTGVDASVIATSPYRDDALSLYPVIARFCESYARIYYRSDRDVVEDAELAAFVAEITAKDGGRIPGVGSIDTVASLAELLSIIVWTATAQHAAVNFTQYPFMGAIPNMAGAFWNAWPPSDMASDDALLALMPPLNLALEQVYTVFQLSSVRLTRLGHYPVAHFAHPPARAAVEQFQRELDAVERELVARDAGRWLRYPYLRPSEIPNSIHI